MHHFSRRAAAVCVGGLVSGLVALSAALPAAADAAVPTASARIVGTVRGFDGAHNVALQGVRVTASPDSQTRDQPVVTAVTGTDGSYRLPKVLPWTYTVCFYLQDSPLRQLGPGGLVDHCHGATTHGSSGTLVSVGPGSTTTVDELLPRGAAVSGTVVDTQGRPVAGGKVSTDDFDDARSTTTDANGHYVLKGISDTGAQICVVPATATPTTTDPGSAATCATTVTPVKAGKVVTADLTLAPGGGASGRVVDTAGRPVAGAQIGEAYQGVVTDADGRFRLGHQTIGNHVLCVTPPAGSVLLPNCPPGGTGAPTYRARAGVFTTVNATLATGLALHGTVTDRDGHRLAGVQVGPRSSEVPVVTGTDGTYTLPTTAPGVTICATPQPTVAGGSPNGYLSTCATIPAATVGTVRHDFSLLKSGAITGLVTDAAGRPVEGVAVSAVGYGDDNHIDFRPAVATDADGRYVVRNLEPEPNGWEVDTSALTPAGDVVRDSRAPAGWINPDFVFPLTVTPPGRTTAATVVLSPASGVGIRIVDTDGAPVTRGAVHVTFEPGITGDYPIDATGHVLLGNLRASTLTVCAVAVPAGPLYPHGLKQVCRDVKTTLGVLTPLTLRQPPVS